MKNFGLEVVVAVHSVFSALNSIPLVTEMFLYLLLQGLNLPHRRLLSCCQGDQRGFRVLLIPAVS